MKKTQKIAILASVLSVASASQGFAAGYSSNLYSTSGLGNSYAGSATATHDASDLFFNPAASANFDKGQAIISASYLNLKIDPDATSANSNGTKVNGRDMSDSGENAVVPALYLSAPINDRASFGFALTMPFGLSTSYKDSWVGRYEALDSQISTLNFNPSISYKISDKLSIGGGVQVQKYSATLTSAYNLGNGNDGLTKLEGSDWGYGYNLGTTYKLNDKTKFGLAYRSKIEHKISGTARLENAGSSNMSSYFNAKTATPESVTLGASHQLDEKLNVAYDLTWTRWSRLRHLSVNAANNNLSGSEEFNWNDSVMHSIGANYKTSEKTLLRAGLAYEKDAVNNRNRTASVPNGNKYWASVGFNYKLSNGFSVDGAYMHQFFQKSTSNIDDREGNTFKTKYKTSVDVISLALKKEF